jgi:hypothetical protein
MVTANGEIWGCPLFPDYFVRSSGGGEDMKYRFGTLEKFCINPHETYEEISHNYAMLRMDNYSSTKMDCFLCPNIRNCFVCPVSSSFTGAALDQIPDYICQIQKIKIRMMAELYESSVIF